MSQSVCRIEGESLILETGMDEASFGKTRLATTLSSNPILLVDFFKIEEKPVFTEFYFTEINSNKDGLVFLSARLPQAFKREEKSICSVKFDTLCDCFKSRPIDIRNKSAFFAVNAITAALKNHQKFEASGAGGIFVCNESVVFLPKNIFEFCLNSCSKEIQAEFNGKYIFKGLQNENALCFLRSVITYQALAEKLPFNQTSEEKRQKDVIDSYFLPLEYAVNGIDKSLALAVNEGLSSKVDFKSETQQKFPIEIFQAELGLDEKLNFSEISRIERPNFLLEDEFKKLSENYFSKKSKITSRERFVQKNKFALAACFASIVLLVCAIVGTLNRISNLPTTKGLNSIETLEQFYTAVNNLDIELLQEVGKGDDVNGVKNVVSAMYVTSKAREGYSNEVTVSPEKWFYLVASDNYRNQPWIYGLSNVEISVPGKSTVKADLSKSAPIRKEKREIIMEENGELPKNGDYKKYTVKYFRIFTHGEEAFLTIENNEDYIFETFERNRWIVSSVSSNLISSSEIKMQDLRDEFEKALSASGGNVKAAISILADKFEWISK